MKTNPTADGARPPAQAIRGPLMRTVTRLSTSDAPSGMPGRARLRPGNQPAPACQGLMVLFLLIVSCLDALAQPRITQQPTDLSLSLCATAVFRVSAKSTNGPLAYQWQHLDQPLPKATNASLVLTNIQTSDAGAYAVIVTDAVGTTNSRAAVLDVDTTFTKVTRGVVVEPVTQTYGCAFANYDDDGFVDLYLGNDGNPRNSLYRNNGDTTFTEVRSGPWSNNQAPHTGGVWADFDNDGYLDLLVAQYDGWPMALYRNRGDGSFTNLTGLQVGLSYQGNYIAAAWADMDSDGYVDFVAPEFGGRCWFYRNNGKGGFTRLSGTGVTTESMNFHGCSWADYDRDGRPDLFLTVYGGPSLLYRNGGEGRFAQVTLSPPGAAAADSVTSSWGDFDNDGYPDLFMAIGGYVSPQTSHLYHNDAGAGFARTTKGGPAAVAQGVSGSWADYDNDGFLDLYVCNAVGQDNCLYHNNGDGTFTQIARGSPVHDGAHSLNGVWGDINNDGFLDLYVANGGAEGTQQNFLYLNNGNTNAWLMLKLAGTVSNRAAIGARVSLLAVIGGKSIWQSREVSGGTGWCAQSDLRVHFGLGDASVAERVRIEWPSGIVQELRQVPTRQFLQIHEPARLEAVAPGIISIRCWKGMAFEVLSSQDLSSWVPMLTVTNLTGTLQVTDPEPPRSGQRFYLVRQH